MAEAMNEGRKQAGPARHVAPPSALPSPPSLPLPPSGPCWPSLRATASEMTAYSRE